jgi:hypothetical protein
MVGSVSGSGSGLVMGPFRPMGTELEGKDPQLLRLVLIHWVRRGSYGRADRTSIARNMDGGGYRSPGGAACLL